MKRIIVLSVSLGLIAVIAITTILMALIPVGRVPQIEKPDFRVYVATTDTSTIGSGYLTLLSKTADDKRDQETIDKVWEEFTNAPKEKAITALFNGTLNDAVKYEKFGSYKYQSVKTTEEDKAVIVFQYSEKQYIDDKGNPTTKDAEKKTEFDHVYFVITAEDERTEVQVMVGLWTTSQIRVYGQYTMSGNFSDLYKVVTEIKTAA